MTLPEKPDPETIATTSGGNVFEDLGLSRPGRLLAKAELARQIALQVDARGLTQAQTAAVLGTSQPKVSCLLSGKLDGFSIERLIRFLNALDCDVAIVVSRAPQARAAGVRVSGPPAHRRHFGA